MKKEIIIALYIICALVTIYGLVTGKFLFLLLMIPFGFGLFNKKKNNS